MTHTIDIDQIETDNNLAIHLEYHHNFIKDYMELEYSRVYDDNFNGSSIELLEINGER